MFMNKETVRQMSLISHYFTDKLNLKNLNKNMVLVKLSILYIEKQ